MVEKDYIQAWNGCLSFIKKNVEEQAFKTWFEPIVPIRLQGDVLTIQVPSQFFYEWLEEHHILILREGIQHELGSHARLEYSVIVDKGNDTTQPYVVNMASSKTATVNTPEKILRNPFELKAISKTGFDAHLNKNYTFDNFIEGDCNRLGRSAGMAVATKPGITSFNPLMIYGGVGLGKTHLIQAIGNHVQQIFPDKYVLYVTSENFVNQFIEALKNNRIEDFRNYYLQIDVLMIDDIQFLAGKEKTQEIFFHIFNHLHQSGKQIIMTSDCPPRDLKGLQERLISRFKWGLTADLQQPDFETRIAIIHRKMQADGIFIPNDVIDYLAYSVDTNVRELEGVMISLIAHASLTKKEVDLELAKQTLNNIIHNVETDVSIDFIQKFIADYFDLPLDSLKAKTRKKEIVLARQLAIYFAKKYTSFSLKSIGYHFGGRDHSTVIHAVQCVNDLMDTDRKFKNLVDELEKKLKIKPV